MIDLLNISNNTNDVNQFHYITTEREKNDVEIVDGFFWRKIIITFRQLMLLIGSRYELYGRKIRN